MRLLVALLACVTLSVPMASDFLNLILRLLSFLCTDFNAAGRKTSHFALDGASLRATLRASAIVTFSISRQLPLACFFLRHSRALYRIEVKTLPDIVLTGLALSDGLLSRDNSLLTDAI